MKKIILFIVALSLAHQALWAINLHRNDIVELAGLAYMLSFNPTEEQAGFQNKEFKYGNMVEMLGYSCITDNDFRAAVEKHFNDFKEHDFIKLIRKNLGTSYDNPMGTLSAMLTLSNHLVLDKGNIVLRPEESIDDLAHNGCFRDKEAVRNFTKLFNAFYHDTDFGNFVKENSVYYERCDSIANNMYKYVNNDYFDSLMPDGKKVKYIPLYSLYMGDSNISGNWKDGDVTVVIGTNYGKHTEYPSEGEYIHKSEMALIQNICAHYADEAYGNDVIIPDNVSKKVFDKFNDKGFNKTGRNNSKNSDLYGEPKDLAKAWMKWVYVCDYMNKTGRLDPYDIYGSGNNASSLVSFATHTEHIYWLTQSLSSILTYKNARELNCNISTYYCYLSRNFDFLAWESNVQPLTHKTL